MKTQTVTVRINYKLCGILTREFPVGTPLEDMKRAIAIQIENEGFVENATGFRLINRKAVVNVTDVMEQE